MEVVIASLITGFFGVIMWGLRRADKRNTDQHADNKQAFLDLANKVENVIHIQAEGVERGRAALDFAKDTNARVRSVDDKIDRHLQWHIEHPGGQ